MRAPNLGQLIIAAPLAMGAQLELLDGTDVAAAPATVTVQAPSKRSVGTPGHHLEYVLPGMDVDVTLTPQTAHMTLTGFAPVIAHNLMVQLALF